MFKLEEGWLTVLLLCVMVTVAAWGMAVASWTPGLWTAWFAGVLGVLAGLALAKSRFSGRRAALFATVYGVFCVGLFVGLTLQGGWHDRSLELVTRLNNFLYKAIHGGTSRDTLPFPVFVSGVFWTIGVTGAWAVFRRGAVWGAVIPGGVALLINAYYYLGPARIDLYLAVYVLLALLLVARVSLLGREREWQSAHVAYNREMRLDFLRAGLMLALAGVLIGWAGPSLAASPAAASAWHQVARPLSTVRETWMRLFASIRAYGQTTNDFYGDSLTLGGPARLNDEPIMDIRIDDFRGEFGPNGEKEPQLPVPRYYWRAAAFDQYTDGRWTSGEGSQLKEFDPQAPVTLRQPSYQLRQDLNVTIISYVWAQSRLYVAPQPKWVDRAATFELVFTPAGTVDISSVRSREILRRGEAYRVIASTSVADRESLNSAGAAYPDWVRARFLQLPDTITDRTRQLAQQIVEDAGAVTPYEQAQAITDWLRQNIAYNQLIDAPPPDVEPVDYLLFTSRQGYCNYYASAEVVLLRALGIPARLAVGFAQGTHDERTGMYHVLEKNAHAWPEVFFPNYGWIEFEPTVSEPPLVRPERPTPLANAGASDAQDQGGSETDPGSHRPDPSELDLESGAMPTLVRWLASLRVVGLGLLGVAAGALAILLGGTAVLLRLGLMGWESLGGVGHWVLRWRGLPIPSAVSTAYLHLERAAHWLRLPLPEAFTPHERAAALSASLPSARPAVETITEQYVTEKYSPHPADGPAAQTAWRRIRFRVWREGVIALLRRWSSAGRAGVSQGVGWKR